jgi:hypothetical protein
LAYFVVKVEGKGVDSWRNGFESDEQWKTADEVAAAERKIDFASVPIFHHMIRQGISIVINKPLLPFL